MTPEAQFRPVEGWTLSTGCNDAYRPIRDVTWPNQEAYATRWGMNWRPAYWPEQLMADGTPFGPSWNRLWNIQECLDRGTSTVVCLDTDAVFLRPDEWIGNALDDKPVHLAYQILSGEIFPSCGLMIVRNCDEGRAWVEELHRLRWRYKDDAWCEQAVAYDLLGYDSRIKSPQGRPYVTPTEWTEHVGFLPRQWHSTPQDPVDNPFLFHATGGVGVGVETRAEQLRGALDLLAVTPAL